MSRTIKTSHSAIRRSPLRHLAVRSLALRNLTVCNTQECPEQLKGVSRRWEAWPYVIWSLLLQNGGLCYLEMLAFLALTSIIAMKRWPLLPQDAGFFGLALLLQNGGLCTSRWCPFWPWSYILYCYETVAFIISRWWPFWPWHFTHNCYDSAAFVPKDFGLFGLGIAPIIAIIRRPLYLQMMAFLALALNP